MSTLKQDISIGQNLKKLRKRMQITQEQIVAQMQLYNCKISRSIYSQMESGTYNIRISELLVLKEIFKCEYSDFFKDLPKPEKFTEN